MVSLSRDEMLRKMVENYGFGSSLFCQVSISDLERIQELYPDFEVYLDQLLQGMIHDPMAKRILEEKYQNDLWLHRPQELEYELSLKDWSNLEKYQNDLERLASELHFLLEKEFDDPTKESYQIRKGDVLNLFREEEDLLGYFIMDTKFRCVYLKLKDQYLDIPVSGEFDMLVNTPANYWNEIEIPNLSFYFDLPSYFSKCKWEKIKVEDQNYLDGEFEVQRRKIHLYVPINESHQDATKLAIGLNVENQILYLPKDPRHHVESGPTVFFTNLNQEILMIENKEDEVEIDYTLD